MVATRSDDRAGMVQQELSKEEWDKRAEALAAEEQARIDLLAKKKSHNRMWNEELIQRRGRIEQLTEEVNTGKAWVEAQTDMFGGGEAANDDGEEEADEPKPRGRRTRRRTAAAEEAASTDA
jgi:hypothetical protein